MYNSTRSRKVASAILEDVIHPKPKFSVYRLNEITAIIMDEIGRDEKKTDIEKGKMFCKIRTAIGKIANAD